MDPMFYAQTGPFMAGQRIENYFVTEGIFNSIEDGTDFLSQYDSDTRNYIMTHTSGIRTKADIVECVRKLKEG